MDENGGAVPLMTNAELATAIAYTYDRCNQTYTGGHSTSTTEGGKVMIEHLKDLLAIQRDRAAMLPFNPLSVRE